MSDYRIIEAAAAYIRSQCLSYTPQIGLILGSGLGDMADNIEQPVYINYADIPYFPHSTVDGHIGRFVLGQLEGKQVIAMQGRFHLYEGYSSQEVVRPIYVMRMLGVEQVIITNAAGGMNTSFLPGDLMVIRDHINWSGDNPLIGLNDERLGVRFPDLSQAYDPVLCDLAVRLANERNGKRVIRQGVYCGISGPSYLPPAELKMLASIGGDAIGMSTVLEVIAARHCQLQVLGISCITDMAIGDSLEPLTHAQVIAIAEQTKPQFVQLITAIIREMI